MIDWTPGTDFERALAATVEARDLAGYLDVLVGGELLLPLDDDVVRDNSWITFVSGDTQAIASFTSGSALTAAGSGKFTMFRKQSLADLVANWPNERWRLGVDVGLSIGAIFDLAQLRTALGISDPPSIGTPPPAATDAVAAVLVDPPGKAQPDGAPAVMQKVVPPNQVGRYLDDGYDLVAGYVYKLVDVTSLVTVADLVAGLGLDYQGSPFSRDDEYAWVIRWQPVLTEMFRVPWGGTDPSAIGAWDGRGWVVERPPFAGNGFAVDRSTPIPEWKVASTPVTNAAEMFRIDREGRQELVAVYNASTARWDRAEGAQA